MDLRGCFVPRLVGFFLLCSARGAPAILGGKHNGLMPVRALGGGDRKIRRSISALVISSSRPVWATINPLKTNKQ